MTTFDLQSAVAAAAEQSADMNVAQKGGGGDYVPPAEGRCGLRFVGYIEIGKQEGTYQGKPKVSDKAFLTFELSGPKWEPKVLDSGEKLPHRITIELNKSLNEKAGYYKLFKAMNWEGKAKIMAQLLGQDFIGRVVHRAYKTKFGKEGVAAELFDKVAGVYTIGAPFVEDMDTGESKRRNIPPALTELKCFLWDHPSKAMWDSIYIDGEYEERKDEKTGEVTAPAKSKNKYQLAIRAAKNFAGSQIEALVEGVTDEALNVAAKTPEQVKAERDAAAAAKAAKDAAAAAKAAAELAKPTVTEESTAEAFAGVESTADSGDAGEDGDDPLNAF
jgi:hypothetical protein